MNNLIKLAFMAFTIILSFQGMSQKLGFKEECKKTIKLTLIRDKQTKDVTMGKLYCDGVFIAYTLERPWKKNLQEVSSIPVGQYFCRMRLSSESGKFNYTHLMVEEVPCRSHILFHIGNTVNDSHGCILTGLVRGKDSLEQSKQAHNNLIKVLSSKVSTIKLTIKTILV